MGGLEESVCVLCGVAKSDTADHLIPQSWYPESTPTDLEKWKYPACRKCNATYSKIEDRLRFALGMCLDAADSLAQGIPEGVLRSVNPAAGRDDRDRRHRERRHARAQREISVSAAAPTEGVFPGFGELDGVEYDKYATITISVRDLGAMVFKFVHGLAYVLHGAYFKPGYVIRWCPVGEEQIDNTRELMSIGTELRRGDAVIIRRAPAAEDPRTALVLVELWGRFRVIASAFRDAADGDHEWHLAQHPDHDSRSPLANT